MAFSTPVQAFSQAIDASSVQQLGEPMSVTVSGPADGDGLRAEKTAAGQTTYFLYDGGAPVVELGASGAVTAANGWGADGWRERAGGNGFFAYAHDPNGNLLARVGSNNVTYPADDFSFYDAYGSLRGDVSVYSGRAVAPRDPMGFGGQFGNYTDVETGLVAMTHRYYDPGTGRFINRDPIDYQGGENLYGYAGNNPVNEMDPSGLAPGPFVPKNDIGESFGPSPTRPKSTLEQLLEARPDLRHMQIMPGDYGAAGMGGATWA